jgi:integrative and conjugative element protein (TIGR02256 family)
MLLGYRGSAAAVADVVVTHDIEAGPKAERERSRFHPDARWQQSKLEQIYERSDRTATYLGDWHSHPRGGPRPSRLDRRTYGRVAADQDARAPYPIILIITLSRRRTKVAAYALLAGEPLELQLVLL